jgi:ketosteroid isomerase-like protein
MNRQEKPIAARQSHVADAFIDAIECGDYDSLLEIYSPSAVVWHNFDNLEVSARENVEAIRAIGGLLKSWRYTNKKRWEIPGGFIQQHTATLEPLKGEILSVHACLICRVENGRITRLEEYFDTAPLQPIFAALSQHD